MTQPVASTRHAVARSGFTNPLSLAIKVTDSDFVEVWADDELLTLGVDYSIAGIGDEDGIEITITNGEDTGFYTDVLTFAAVFDPLLEQGADLSAGGTFGLAFEAAIDALNRQIQSLDDRLRRSLTLPPTYSDNAQIAFPIPVAGRVLVGNDTATGYENGPTVPEIDIIVALTAEIETLSAIAAEIETLADMEAVLDALYAIRVELASLGAVTSAVVALDAIKAEIVAVEAIVADIQAVVANLTDIQNAEENAAAAAASAASLVAADIVHYTAETNSAARKAVARNNIGAQLEPGIIAHFATSSAPAGWLKANGALVSRTTYEALFTAIGTTYGVGDGSTTFGLPDLRGEFIRGWDDGRGVDAGRAIATSQVDEFKSHQHSYSSNGTGSTVTAGAGSGAYYIPASFSTGATGGAETRPRNVALLACIKF